MDEMKLHHEMKLHLGLIERVIFQMLKLARKAQNFISEIYWFIIVKPLLWIAYKIWGKKRDNDETVRRIIFHAEKPFARRYCIFLKWVLTLNGWLSGLKERYSAYDFLLGWNPSIPLIALEHTKNTYCIDLLGPEERNRAGWHRLIDELVLSTSHEAGHFKVTKKTFDASSTPPRATIECIWLSGEAIGQKFTIGWLGFSKSRNQVTPNVIYFPPRPVVIVFEIILALSAFTALIAFLMHGFHLLAGYMHTSPLLQNMVHWLRLAIFP